MHQVKYKHSSQNSIKKEKFMSRIVFVVIAVEPFSKKKNISIFFWVTFTFEKEV